HAGVDEDDDGARLEQGEGERVELQRGRHHQDDAGAAADADMFEAAGQDVALGVEFTEGEVAVADAPGPVAAVRLDQRERLRPGRRHRGRGGGDVDDGGTAHPEPPKGGRRARKSRTRGTISAPASSRTKCPASAKAWTSASGKRRRHSARKSRSKTK